MRYLLLIYGILLFYRIPIVFMGYLLFFMGYLLFYGIVIFIYGYLLCISIVFFMGYLFQLQESMITQLEPSSFFKEFNWLLKQQPEQQDFFANYQFLMNFQLDIFKKNRGIATVAASLIFLSENFNIDHIFFISEWIVFIFGHNNCLNKTFKET